ncbi:hypothetical protein SISNIDRAFT_407232 [Sistotremastrum niveocremeum HHB9708]|uniref:Auxin efflux carrier n=1 Tax=Sistotremastrum niveocremeum HHB9708 TaxID=1314777 RepID=A0A164XW09_9AGAM|nr:hypothetical protein SISNIDRAFT_407232 [Sistotremastrum niveocremeum HHB9708]
MSSLAVTLLASFESSVSVLLTLFYGTLASKYNFLSTSAASQISRLCIQVFLPALLFTSLGSELGSPGSSFHTVWPVIVWSLIYPMLCLGLTYPLVLWFKFPTWCFPAAAFNNTTSLPLLLVEALVTTGALDDIVGVGDQQKQGITRLRSYFLMNTMVANALTFTIGPTLLRIGHRRKPRDEQEEATGEDATPNDGADQNHEGGNEHTPLLIHNPKKKINGIYSRFPKPIRAFVKFIYEFLNPPLVAVILAVIIGKIPPLRKAFFDDEENGGVLNAWFTISIENIGGLFTSLQMFVVGSKLYAALQRSSKPEEEDVENSIDLPQDNKLGVASSIYLILLRFVILPAFSTSVVYLLLKHTKILGSDPTLWFALIIAGSGPPAIRIASLSEMSGQSEKTQQAIARMLTGFYIITPLVSFAVVAGLKVCDLFL